jgi:hypothetical protein
VPNTTQDQVHVFDPKDTVRGETIAQWTENWWQWAFQAPANGSALGYPAPQPVNGKVFFIGANEGATINVPTGMPILVPMINAFDLEGPGIPSDSTFDRPPPIAAKLFAQLYQAAITNAFLTITKDGQTLVNLQSPHGGASTFFAELSDQFAIGAPQPGSQIANLLAGAVAGGADISALPPPLPFTRSAGDWAMLALPPGTYEFHFGGSISDVYNPYTPTHPQLLIGGSFDTHDTVIVG